MLVSDLIKASLQTIGVLSAGETPSVSLYAQILSSLQNMLYSWTANQVNIFAATDENVSTVIGTSFYTWGTGGDITTTRPHQILQASITDTETPPLTHFVKAITKDEYKQIEAKTTAGRPTKLYFDSTYPLANLYLWPVPAAVETIAITTYKIFPTTSSYDVVTSTISVPPEYLEALIYNLSIRIAPYFGKVVSKEIMFVAESSYTRLVNLNTKSQQLKELDSSEIIKLRALLNQDSQENV